MVDIVLYVPNAHTVYYAEQNDLTVILLQAVIMQFQMQASEIDLNSGLMVCFCFLR